MTLTGNKCKCPSCSKLFASSAAFDKHRVKTGEKGERACLGYMDMVRKGMYADADGFWKSSRNGRFQ